VSDTGASAGSAATLEGELRVAGVGVKVGEKAGLMRRLLDGSIAEQASGELQGVATAGRVDVHAVPGLVGGVRLGNDGADLHILLQEGGLAGAGETTRLMWNS
jgi:hypothetical protein